MTKRHIRILVSACLLGEKTRYDGSHKRCDILNDACFAAFDFVSICPEKQIGMGTPRPPVQLVSNDHQIEIRGRDNHALNITTRLREFSKNYATTLSGIYGAILKKDSPSCGIREVKVFSSESSYNREGIGEFAYQMLKAQNAITKEVLIDEEQIQDSRLRQLFIENVLKNAGITN